MCSAFVWLGARKKAIFLVWYVCAKVLFILYLLISAIKREPDLSEAGTGHCGYTCTTNYKILGLVFGR